MLDPEAYGAPYGPTGVQSGEPKLEPSTCWRGNAWQPLTISIPPPVDMLFRVGLDADAEAALRERESLLTAAATGRSVEALCEAYGYLGRAKRRYQIAQQIPGATLAQAPSPATEWAWECAFPRPYDTFVRAEETGHKLPSGLLHAVIGEALALGCRRISFGRTALEPKAGLGARPERMWLWVRHRNPVMNALLRKLLRAVPHGAAPERSPFNTAASER